ncbi:MAG: ketol-acid reductoisomerase [Fimbriimonadaceae bacterium]|nr:ketol-acid reductoisomerase [Fimbriimonadaceae bacterium]
MADFLFTQDVNPEIIKSKRVAIIGYGSQGHSHALNLRDSGVNVIVGLHETSQSIAKAQEQGFAVLTTCQAVREADVIMMCTPDVPMARIYAEDVAPYLREGQALLFAHGFNIRYKTISPPEFIDVAMVSPKGPGPGLRAEYLDGRGLPALFAVHQDATGNAEQIALSYAWGIGSARAGLLKTTFQEETETDLFGEQAVLCGGIPALIAAGAQTLIDAGYTPEVAYFECLHETRLIVDLLYRGGLTHMNRMISETAEWGGYLAGQRLVTDETRAEMKKILSEIQSGEFAKEWIAENESGQKRMAEFRAATPELPVEKTGRELRRVIPVIDDVG